MKKTLTLAQLAGYLGGKLWEKGTMCRIYLNKGYNTKKMSTKTYVYKTDDGDFRVVCNIDCPSQHDNWIAKEEQAMVESVSARIIDIIEEHGIEQEEVITMPVDVVINNAVLDAEPVIGYYTEWRQVRVAINSYGKLATRNRQFVVAFKGTKNNAPKNFTTLSETGYAILANRPGGEEMLEPYAPMPDYEQRAAKYSNSN